MDSIRRTCPGKAHEGNERDQHEALYDSITQPAIHLQIDTIVT